jgi:hypothetical protein
MFSRSCANRLWFACLARSGAAAAACVVPFARSKTVCMPSRPVILHRSPVFSYRICRLVHLTVWPPGSICSMQGATAACRRIVLITNRLFRLALRAAR